ncbi:OLC1v1028728C1 [Oldenlandia corymbosa var. corymbosa]|uniref:OLC1v1028728C1 n=1 Tax=Oldenlandia corymbosa var. corymbosa TaxID=529605 RepID=A0AAV1CEY2_OLDCO|nr:OLC1v1028728C1 [Oldenlandia corymbosa var. corymbosa]
MILFFLEEHDFSKQVAADDKVVLDDEKSGQGACEKPLEGYSAKEKALELRGQVGTTDVISHEPKLSFGTGEKSFVSDVMFVLLKLKVEPLDIRKQVPMVDETYDRFNPTSPFYTNNPGRVHFVDDEHHFLYPRRERGTTTIAFIFKEGVMIAADHSSELSVPNVICVNNRIVATVSGGSEYLLERLQRKCCAYENMTGTRVSVAEAAKCLAGTVSPSMSTGGLLIGGMDEEGEFDLYYINRGGELMDVKLKRNHLGNSLKWICYATGSGAVGAMIYLQSKMKPDMSVTQAKEVAKAAICFTAFSATVVP